VLQILALLLFLMCSAASIFEAIAERDWPRDTFRYVLMSGACLIATGIF
jgi:hypothetical protein